MREIGLRSARVTDLRSGLLYAPSIAAPIGPRHRAYTLTCAHCSGPFRAARRDARTCSIACRVADHRDHHRAAPAPYEPPPASLWHRLLEWLTSP
jgi:hypothetical protein